jgi:hypothetical protein
MEWETYPEEHPVTSQTSSVIFRRLWVEGMFKDRIQEEIKYKLEIARGGRSGPSMVYEQGVHQLQHRLHMAQHLVSLR